MGTPIVTTDGLDRAAQVILDDISHCAVGTTGNLAVIGDTQLNEETRRDAIDKSLRQGAVLQARTLFSNGDLPTTLKEIGLFMNGAAGANTGSLLSRVVESFTKASADLLVVWEITISEA